MIIGTLVFFCGKMGVGKSTKAQQISHDGGAVLLSGDEWLMSLISC
ncbi:AAA family ATPase [Thiomicrorhabdus heinhorstiae]|nr:AAA family ATPase [Thiomicrorhabdus heinhorstiae]